MLFKSIVIILSCLSLTCPCTTVRAQSWEVLLTTDAPLPNPLTGGAVHIDHIRFVIAGPPQVFAALVNSEADNTQTLLGWNANSLGLIRTFEPTILSIPPNFVLVENTLSMSSLGEIGYSSLLADRPGGLFGTFPGFADSIWYEPSYSSHSEPIRLHLQNDQLSNFGDYESSCTIYASPGPRGVLSCTGITDARGGLSIRNAIILNRDDKSELLLKGGTELNGGSMSIAPLGIRAGCLSPDGHSMAAIAEVQLDGRREEAVVNRIYDNGEWGLPEVTVVTGAHVEESTLSELWRNIRAVAVSNSPTCSSPRRLFVLGDTTAAPYHNTVLAIDGVPAVREGDIVSGGRLLGPPGAMSTNGAGDVAFVWPIVFNGDPAKPTLLLNDHSVLACGAQIFYRDSLHNVDHIYPTLTISEQDGAGNLSIYCVVRLSHSSNHAMFDAVVRSVINGMPTTYCTGDFNQDGNADQTDVDALINVVAGGEPEGTINPDYNCDGNVDQGDVDALINVIAGGDCD